MDIKAIIDQVTEHLGNSPEALKDFIADPASAIEGITGHQLEGDDLSGVVDGIKEGVMGGGFHLPEGIDQGGPRPVRYRRRSDRRARRLAALRHRGGSGRSVWQEVVPRAKENRRPVRRRRNNRKGCRVTAPLLFVEADLTLLELAACGVDIGSARVADGRLDTALLQEPLQELDLLLR